MIKTNKTETMFQWTGARPHIDPVIKTNDVPLQTSNQFTYLGSILTTDCTVDAEVNRLIKKASATLSQIRKRVIAYRNLRIASKVSTYRAVCLNVLSYATETLSLYGRHVKQMEVFHMQCLKKILRLTWEDRVPNVDILERTKNESAECLLLRLGLRWTGHVLRMPDSRMPKRMFFGQLTKGTRNIGKRTMKKFNIDPGRLETAAADRAEWRRSVHDGATHFDSERARERIERSRRRHARPTSLPNILAPT